MSFRIAEKQALKSKYLKHRVGAVIVKGDRILSTGYNQIRPSKLLGVNTLHAEAAAVLSLLKQRRFHDLLGSTCYVTRFTRGGNLGLARPCESCVSILRSVGVSSVMFSADENNVGTMKL